MTTEITKPSTDLTHLSDDQAHAYDRAANALKLAGIDITNADHVLPPSSKDAPPRIMAILGKAGSGKTHLMSIIDKALQAADCIQITGDVEVKRRKETISYAVVAPTNKAASVLRSRGVQATTIHRIIYTPVYDPLYEAIVEWLATPLVSPKPEMEGLTDEMLKRASEFYDQTKSAPGALAAIGLRGSEFLKGWTKRDDAIDIGLVDEASMLDSEKLDDLADIFNVLILFGDPAQLAPVMGRRRDSSDDDGMAVTSLPTGAKIELSRNHRQTADNPIVDLAYALQDPALRFHDFEDMIKDAAQKDERVEIASKVNSDLMARSPVLVWRNNTRIRLIAAFRAAHGIAEDALAPGEPLICDGIELPVKHRKKRLDLEQAGLVKGAQVFYRGPGNKSGFSRIWVDGAENPKISAATIIKIEKPDVEEPFIPFAARMGAAFVHGAACTVHKAQGSQWHTVQIFAPDIAAAANSGLIEANVPLWKRLTYVAVTRSQAKMIWATRYAISRPKTSLSADDLVS